MRCARCSFACVYIVYVFKWINRDRRLNCRWFGNFHLADGFQKISTSLSTVACVRESTKPISYSKWGHFERSKLIFKILLASWTLYTVENRFRSFTAKNLGSVGQRAAKLLAIKLWEWFNPGSLEPRPKALANSLAVKAQKCTSAKFGGQ